ncbi:MAG: ATP-binding cassette domain-containing protein [Desulfocapsaceae bacterium]|nr:ATP-binding cassette domain-containing protein [Desulfocapsaceae bacterium]
MILIDIQDLISKQLNISQWTIETQQRWCLIGTTGSGKSQLARIFQEPEKMVFQSRLFEVPPSCLCVGLEAQQAQLEAELYDDDTDFMDQIDQGHTGLELLQQTGAENAAIRQVVEQFKITDLLEKGYRVLSSGETRKLLIARALLAKPDLLILDEPFEGLDKESSQSLADFLVDLKEQQALLMFVSQLQDVQEWHTHIGVLHKGRLLAQGEKDRIMNNDSLQTLFHFDSGNLLALPPALSAPVTFDPLFHMRNCKVRYGEVIQFQNLNWVLRPGEHTIISGPNGSGKSTLLQLITGDHPQCFNNGLTAFGYQRGSGESIWDIKKHIGLVSGALHQDYRVPGNALTVVASGLYDSIGVYRSVSDKEKRIAHQWLAFIGLKEKADIAFKELSWGEQRLVLIARALIKYPALLILDEPTLGLDDQNRLMVLACLERIAGLGASTMLFVSHRQDEHLKIFRKHLVFEPDKEALFSIFFRENV